MAKYDASSYTKAKSHLAVYIRSKITAGELSAEFLEQYKVWARQNPMLTMILAMIIDDL